MIPIEIYRQLTPAARLRTVISAIARHDESELDNLKSTCPKKSFRMADPDFSEKLTRLLTIASAIESDLMGFVLNWMLASRLEQAQAAHDAILGIDSLDAAWKGFLDENGIQLADMQEAGPARHPAVSTVLEIAEGKADPSAVESLKALMTEYFNA